MSPTTFVLFQKLYRQVDKSAACSAQLAHATSLQGLGYRGSLGSSAAQEAVGSSATGDGISDWDQNCGEPSHAHPSLVHRSVS